MMTTIKSSGLFAAADEGENAVVGVVGVNPFETVPVEFDLMEGGLGGVEMIEIGDELLDAAMGIVLEQDASRGCELRSIRGAGRVPGP